ncbi:hypothetical protein [Nocardia terpenica]|uniref:Uncharacterized protein n=1 Tax=Nocardia terpenica TaxID=455432 RepID=A0A6G9ZDP6_9NOCA|nr:hypothetical protein [Nocardia terpenica]QIS23546.1 hypothetical protein F6W96_39955 [Nocardia terpenica]QIS23560.1 hypothetical protein F6W96_40050 [Nocardia terpenica]
MSDLDWLVVGARAVIQRHRVRGLESLPGTVIAVTPGLAWGHVCVRADRGGIWSFNLDNAGMCPMKIDANGFDTELEPEVVARLSESQPS